MRLQTNLSSFNNDWYKPGSKVKIVLWFVVHWLFFVNPFTPSGLKIVLLRLFGAIVGKKVVVKPFVRIKYPWFLEIGDFSWIGESVWIDNLMKIKIGSHVCLSQGAMLLTGNHNYKKVSFDLIAEGIELEDGAWIGAKAVVCPGVKVASHAVLTVGSVATKHLQEYTIYQGNPAVAVKKRTIEE